MPVPGVHHIEADAAFGDLLPHGLGEVGLDEDRAGGRQRRAAEAGAVHRLLDRDAELQDIEAVLQDVLQQADARRARGEHRAVAPEEDVRRHVRGDAVAGPGHDPEEVGAGGADAHSLGEEAVAPRIGHAGMEDRRHIPGGVHHGYMVAAGGRRRLRGGSHRVTHLQQLEPHPGVLRGEDGLQRQRVALRVVLPRALGVHQVADAHHLQQTLGGFGRRTERFQVKVLQHLEHLDEVGAAVVGRRGTGDPPVAVAAPARFLPPRFPAGEIVRRQHAAGGLHHFTDAAGELAPVEVVVPLFGEALQGVGGALLDEEPVRPRDRAVVEEDLAPFGSAADLLRLDEDLAPEEGVHLEALAGVGDGRRHQVLAGERTVAVVRGFEPAPPAGDGHAAPGGEVVDAVARQRRQRRVHAAVDIGGLAGGGVVEQLREAAGDRGHVRLDHGLGHRGGEGRVAGVPAALEHFDGFPGGERVGGDRHAALAGRRLLPPEVGAVDEALPLGAVRRGRGGRRRGERQGRGAGEAAGGVLQEAASGRVGGHCVFPSGRPFAQGRAAGEPTTAPPAPKRGSGHSLSRATGSAPRPRSPRDDLRCP